MQIKCACRAVVPLRGGRRRVAPQYRSAPILRRFKHRRTILLVAEVQTVSAGEGRGLPRHSEATAGEGESLERKLHTVRAVKGMAGLVCFSPERRRLVAAIPSQIVAWQVPEICVHLRKSADENLRGPGVTALGGCKTFCCRWKKCHS